MGNRAEVAKLIHDLRNPINSIAMTAELAKLQVASGESADAIVENLETIVRLCRDCGVRLEVFAREGEESSR
ncbi:MAG: histidine kinase dimerization/phospho-acceptor domain-containing protein [Candidatus Eisenbacteria bacterium]|uniref:Histidine kinase n=1 Tax=Eiseniibacteriota bacterium TaxID=2212470 RepID=A0A956LZC2_UNCEI|nr:histidine kinase [Candidatus Eisenbacteria bacterium]